MTRSGGCGRRKISARRRWPVRAGSYDGGPWEKLAEKTVEAKRQSIDLPFVPRRCGTLRLRLEGAGQITLRGLAKTMAKAQGGIFAAGKEG